MQRIFRSCARLCILILGAAWRVEAALACPLAEAHAQKLNQELVEACGAGAPQWDLSEYVPDDEICSGRQAALSLVQRQIRELCAANSRQKLKEIKILHARARLVNEFQFKREGRRLSMVVPIKESPVLTGWNQHVELLAQHIGQPRSTSPQVQSEVATASSADEASERAENKARQDREQAREKKLNALKTELDAAGKRFQLRIKAVWASPTTDADEIARRQLEVEQITRQFEAEQNRIVGEMQNVK